jgi:pseudaminic acid cytidylyltransferase
MNKNIYCVIPARGGSKRIKNKNVIFFNKKPIIYYPITVAKKTNLFKKIIVSTDSKKIKLIAEKFGAYVPYLRDKKISDDKTTTKEVLIDSIKKNKLSGDYIFLLYPSTPLLKKEYLINGLKKIKKEKADCLISVKEFESNPYRSLKQNKQKYLEFNNPKFEKKNSQDLPKLFFDAGMFYIFRINKLLHNKNLLPKKTIGFILKKYSSIDINEKIDLKYTRLLFKSNKSI